MAETAASLPLLPSLVPARSIACSIVSAVIMPNITGIPESWPALAIPFAASDATKSKCGVGPPYDSPQAYDCIVFF